MELASKKNIPEMGHFFAFGLIPPETPSQCMQVNSIIQRPSGYFLSDRKGYVVNVTNTEKKFATIEAEWDISLRSTTLRPKYQGEVFLRDNMEYPQEELIEATKQTECMDIEDKSFAEWLEKYGLMKGLTGMKETNVYLACKIYLAITRTMLYRYPCTERKASEIVKSGYGDSLALNIVMVAALRFNNIPSRLIYGRMATSKVKGQTISWIGGDSGIENEQMGVKSQFFMDGVGWITADPTMYLKNTNPKWDSSKEETLLGGFGKDGGDFMIFSVESGFVELPMFGPTIPTNFQEFSLLFEHKRTDSDWVVIKRSQ
jgi:transglutaminase-like putative cysteine protease